MEDKMMKILDGADLQEADKMLTEHIYSGILVDKDAAERIKDSVYHRAGLERPKSVETEAGTSQIAMPGVGQLNEPEQPDIRRIKRRLTPRTMTTAAAIAVMILSFTFFAAGPDNVLAAIQKIFHFIPGYGIIEDDGEYIPNKIEYILAEPVTTENDEAILSLKNAVASKDNITVMFELTRKNMTEELIMKEKEEEWQRTQTEDKLEEPGVYLYTQKNRYSQSNGSWGSGGATSQFYMSYSVSSDEINTFDSYKLEYEPFNLSLEFKLKNHEIFNSLEEIGATDVHNNISITAVAEEKDGKLNVELYPINYNDQNDPNGYSIYSFKRDDLHGYLGDDLHLQTNTGKKDYTIPGSYMGPNTKFAFDITPEDKDLILKLPYILVQSREQCDVALDIPKLGETIEVNQEVAFDGCTLIINKIERVKWEGSDDECLRMNFRYVNESPEKILKNFGIIEINRLGRWLGGGGSWQVDDNGITVYYDFFLEKKNQKNICLRFQNPIYYLTDEYTFKLNK